MTRPLAFGRLFAQLALLGTLGWAPGALGQELAARVSAAAAERYELEADEIYALELSGDPASMIELARLLMRGVLSGPDNPLPRPDLDRAADVLDAAIEAADAATLPRALALKADLLARRATPEARAERAEIDARLLELGYAPAIADLLIAGAPLPEGLDVAAARAALEPRVLAGDAKATQALALLLATADPARSAALAAQASMLAMSSAADSVKATTDLGQRFLDGSGVQVDRAEGLRLLQEAAMRGSGTAVDRLDDELRKGTAGLVASDMRDVVMTALAAGASDAADIVARDFADTPLYGFSREDALFALRLLRETGDREALLRAVQIHASGVGGAPDFAAAVPLIEELVAMPGQTPEDVLRVALKLEAINLPLPLALKYLEPMFRSIGGNGADEANYQADRLLAAAYEAGIASARSLPRDRRDAILAELRAAGGRGHVRSLILLGDLYYAGIWVAPTYRQAMGYYEQALALEPSLVARERVAKALLQIKQTPFEEARFAGLIGELAAAGSAWGQYRYGLLLIDGTGTQPPDVAAGENLLLTLASQGFAPAVRAMIDRLRDDPDAQRLESAIEAFTKAWATRKDFKTGRQLGEFYILAGRQDDARSVLGEPMFAKDPGALFALARMEAAENPVRAFELAAAGLAAADEDRLAVDLAELLLGLPLPMAKAEAERHLRQMADAGNTDAISLLVRSYLDRLATDASLLETVAAWTLTLAQAGEVTPIIELVSTYLSSQGEPAMMQKVLPVAEQALAVLPADTYVAVLVAQAYYNGWGTAPDVARGNRLIEAAAAAGNGDALAELGLQYFYGMGRARSSETGIALLDSAAALGHGVARVELGRLNSSATGPGVDRVKAYSMFLEAAGQGSSAGMLEVGRLYLAGWGIGQDEKRGIDWLERAASLGNFDAMYQLYFHYLSKPDPVSQSLARLWLDRSVAAGVNPARLRLAVHLLSDADSRGSNHDDAVSLLDDAFSAGYNTARKFSQTTTAFDLPIIGDKE